MDNTKESITLVFAVQKKINSIYPYITREIAEAQKMTKNSKAMLKRKVITPR